jgi:four helix bundle protein
MNAECGVRVPPSILHSEIDNPHLLKGLIMIQEDLKQRTKNFSISIIKLVEMLPRGRISDVVGKQLLRSGTSVGANYRSACRAKSTADFIHKMGTVEEEADESLFWLQLLIDTHLLNKELVEVLMNEANEIIAIVVTSIKTARRNKGTI